MSSKDVCNVVNCLVAKVNDLQTKIDDNTVVVDICPVIIGRGAEGPDSSVVLGCDAKGSNESVVIGNFATSNSNSQNVVSGFMANADETCSVVVGHLAEAKKVGGVAIGKDTVTNEEYGIAIGKEAVTSGVNGIALGASSMSLHNNTTVINSQSAQLVSGATGALYVKPIRSVADGATGPNLLCYNPVSGEVFHRVKPAFGPTSATGATGATSPTGRIETNGSCFSDYLYWNNLLGVWSNGNDDNMNRVHIGCNSGFTGQGPGAVAIGFETAEETQGDRAVAIGRHAGKEFQGENSVAVGYQAGMGKLDANSGEYPLGTTGPQGTGAVAVGFAAGQMFQGDTSVAIGMEAGQNQLGLNSVAIGHHANQRLSRIKYGTGSGPESTIVINSSGIVTNTKHPNTIMLNSSTGGFDTQATGAFYVKPIRGPTGLTGTSYDMLCYDTDACEVVRIKKTQGVINFQPYANANQSSPELKIKQVDDMVTISGCFQLNTTLNYNGTGTIFAHITGIEEPPVNIDRISAIMRGQFSNMDGQETVFINVSNTNEIGIVMPNKVVFGPTGATGADSDNTVCFSYTYFV
jgi:hypothetical protein